MNDEKRLSSGARGILIVAGLFFDGLKIGLDAAFGLGIILDPLLITPIATVAFWLILDHNGISMFSGKHWVSGWVNMIFSFIPILDVFPDWTVYAIYLSIKYR
jgi:hypothetical protein